MWQLDWASLLHPYPSFQTAETQREEGKEQRLWLSRQAPLPFPFPALKSAFSECKSFESLPPIFLGFFHSFPLLSRDQRPNLGRLGLIPTPPRLPHSSQRLLSFLVLMVSLPRLHLCTSCPLHLECSFLSPLPNYFLLGLQTLLKCYFFREALSHLSVKTQLRYYRDSGSSKQLSRLQF